MENQEKEGKKMTYKHLPSHFIVRTEGELILHDEFVQQDGKRFTLVRKSF